MLPSTNSLVQATTVRQFTKNAKASLTKNDFKSADLEYKTQLEPLGKKLPKGIAVKILLARAIVIRPRLLLMEGNLEYLEDDEKNEIIDFLMSPENPWTLVVATSDPYFISKANRVLGVQDGRISFDNQTAKSK